MMTKPQLINIFFWPTVIGLLTLLGLVLALLVDGVLEDISLIALAFPIIVVKYIYIRRPKPSTLKT